METNFQLLMLSPNLLKSKVPIFWGWGLGVGGNQFPTFDAEFNLRVDASLKLFDPHKVMLY